jgi:RNA polymerase sigma factor (sigma-70 family)
VEGRPLEEEGTGSPQPGDGELVERARDGDVGAYEELVRRHQSMAARVAYLVLGAGGDVEEAVQEGFMKAYGALARFRDGAPFRPWLLTIVANEARNRRKSAARRARLALRVAEVGGDRPSGDAAPSPEVAVLAGEDRELLMAALNGLREEDRLVVGYRYLLGLSERETAEALRVPPGTVKSRLSRALTRLRQELTVTAERADG